MSRAVQEDLSGLSFGERASKRFANFRVWVYNTEDGTIMGERHAKEWGQLLLYYLVFYSLLAAFTAIFFGVLGFMLPIRPNIIVPGMCSPEPNALDACGRGPFFQALDLSEIGEPTENQFTDEIFQFGLCDPGFVAIPRSLTFGGVAPTSEYNSDKKRRGYRQFTDEVDRVYCQKDFDSPLNPDCDQTTLAVNKRILPLVPSAPSATRPFYAPNMDDFVGIAEKLSETPYVAPKPLYSFGPEGAVYETYMVFFRFNKVWNYQPYAVLETNGEAVPMEKNFGIDCTFKKPCTDGTTKNYKNEDVPCDSKTASEDNRIKIDVLSNVMTNFDGFPWRGGPLNMNFGSMAVTFKTGEPLREDEDRQIICTMGGAVNGFSGVSPDGDAVVASANVIANMNKQGPARAYTNSDGYEIKIPINM